VVATQVSGVATLTSARARLASMLTGARAHASALEQAHLAALAHAREAAAAQRRAAAARAARQRVEHQPVGPVTGGGGGGGGGGSGGGGGGGSTVSAATEQAAVREAESQIGKPYEWGASGPDSYDCSGLVMWSYAQVGVHVDHWTGDQWNEGEHIPLSALRPGDLLFFATDTSNPDTIHHVGIYIGNAQMVEAPYTGANVRISNAFRPDLIGAVRFYNR
jgi:cell wall-associated NlpC family hydrolase